MNKQEFCWVCECALLSYDNVSELEMIRNYNIRPEYVKLGKKLFDYMESKLVIVRERVI